MAFFSELKKIKRRIKTCVKYLDILDGHLARHDEHQLNLQLSRSFDDVLSYPTLFTPFINEQSLKKLDPNKETVLITCTAYRNIEHFRPLIEKFKQEGHQILYFALLNKDACFFIADADPVVFVPNTHGQHELLSRRYDYMQLLYYIINNFNIKLILQQEWTNNPLEPAYHGVPLLPGFPPIFSMRHSLSTFYELPLSMKEFYEQHLTKYFVWGNYHKELFYKPSEKVIAAGYNKLDKYKDIETSTSNSVFVVGQHLNLSSGVSMRQMLISLLDSTDYTVKFKAHPSEIPHWLNVLRDEVKASKHADCFILLDQHADYTEDMRTCDFVLSYGSNMIADALVMNKPVCLFESNYAADPVYMKTPGNILLLKGAAPTTAMILDHVDKVKTRWNEVEEFKEGLLANMCNSTDFIYQEIITSIKK